MQKRDHLETTYCNLVLSTMLALQSGESLSINTEAPTLDFATKIAQMASEVTLQPVNIVVLDHGVPKDVLSITPVEHAEAGIPTTGHVLLRLDNTEEDRASGYAAPEEAIMDMRQLQRTGILADPPWIREIAPWALVPVPGPAWSKRIMGNTDGAVDKTWELMSEAYKLETSDPVSAWIEQLHLLDFRISQLSSYGTSLFQVTGGETEFTFRPAPRAQWRHGGRTLANGRTFIPMMPLERISILPDPSSIDGIIHSTRDFTLFGGIVKDAVFKFDHGVLVSFDAKQGVDLVKAVLSVDTGASMIGEISFADHQRPFSRFHRRFGQTGLDMNSTSFLCFGASDTSHFSLDGGIQETEITSNMRCCNASDIRLQIDIGSPQLRATAVMESGEHHVFLANGRFLQ